MIPPLLVASTAAVFLYLLPALVGAASGPPRAPFTRCLDAATALAVDALATVVLARVVPLHLAVWILRGLWLAALLGSWRRGSLSLRPIAPLLALGAVCGAMVALSFHRLSYAIAIWDRDWHIPLVSALRVQRAPFENVFLPRAALRYHYLGDVAAAAVQSLSAGRINASRALSLTHDTHVGLLATSLSAACFFAARAHGGRWSFARGVMGATVGLLGAWATAFASPFVLTHAPLQELRTTLDSGLLCGHSHLPFASIAYRPHVGLAGYFIGVTFLALGSAARSAPRGEDLRRHTAAALASAAALALCDEASHALVAFALGFTATLVPGALGGRWTRGVLTAVAFGALLPVVSAGLDGSLGLGGAASRVELVPWRHLKLFDEPVALTDRVAFMRVLKRDYFPQLAASGLSLLCALWTRRRAEFAVALFYPTLVGLSLWSALRVEVNHSPDEGHRFITASMVLAPMVAAWLAASTRGAWPLRVALLGVLLASGGSGWAWRDAFIRHRFVGQLVASERRWTGTYNPNDVDCARFAGSPRPDPPPVEYVDADIAYVWSGCQPVRLLGGASKWNLAVHGIRTGWVANAGYEAEGPEVLPTAVVCEASPSSPWRSDPCAWATQRLRCDRVGIFSRCALPPASREEFFRTLR